MSSLIIAKLKIRVIKEQIHVNMKDIGSDGNLISIKMYKTLFQHTNINEINKSINNKNSVKYLYQLMHTTNEFMQSHNSQYRH